MSCNFYEFLHDFQSNLFTVGSKLHQNALEGVEALRRYINSGEIVELIETAENDEENSNDYDTTENDYQDDDGPKMKKFKPDENPFDLKLGGDVDLRFPSEKSSDSSQNSPWDNGNVNNNANKKSRGSRWSSRH